VERLEYVVASSTTGAMTAGEAAEHLVNVAAMSGGDWLAVKTTLDHALVAEVFEKCKVVLEERFKAFRGDCMREDRDRIKLMVNMLERHLENQSKKINDRIHQYRSGTEQQRRLIPAEEGRLRKLRERLNGRIEELRLKERASASESFVSGGVISLT
jgi:hypothetical protein